VKKSRTANYILGLSTGYAVSIASLVVGLWMTPYVLRFLSRQQYGVFALASSVIGWFQLLDFGMSTSLRLHLSQLAGKAEPQEISRSLSTTFFIQSGIALLVLLAGLSATFWFPRFFNTSVDQLYSVRVLLCLLTLGAAISLQAKSFSSLLVAHQQIYVDNLIRLCLLAVQTTITIVLVARGWGLAALGLASLVAVAITALLAVVRSYRTVPGLSIRPSLFCGVWLKKVWAIAVWFSVASSATLLIRGLDHSVAAKLVSLEAVTIFSLTKRPYDIIETFLSQMVDTARPGLGQMAGQGLALKVAETHLHLTVFGTGLAITAASAIWAGNRAFVSAWVGEANYGGWGLDAALALVVVVRQWTLPHRAVLSAALKVRAQSICGLLEGLVNLGLSILFTLVWGLSGVATSTLLGLLLTSAWYVPRLAMREFHISAGGIWANVLRRLFLHLILSFSVAGGLRWITDGQSGYLVAAASGGLAGLAAIFSFWGIVLDAAGRSRARALIFRTVT
jgi:O-antigen/teichoic acid export membrane protein